MANLRVQQLTPVDFSITKKSLEKEQRLKKSGKRKNRDDVDNNNDDIMELSEKLRTQV